MAPTLSKYTEVRERLIAQVAAFLNTSEANYFGQTITFLDHAPSPDDIWATPPILAIWWDDDDEINFIVEERRQVVLNTTSIASMKFRGYTRGDWNDAEAFEVDCRRAVLERPGLGCAATSSLWARAKFTMEVQKVGKGQSRRCSFESVLAIQVAEDLKP